VYPTAGSRLQKPRLPRPVPSTAAPRVGGVSTLPDQLRNRGVNYCYHSLRSSFWRIVRRALPVDIRSMDQGSERGGGVAASRHAGGRRCEHECAIAEEAWDILL
jgi:hypothetical protein